jgi:hypothetical protein
VALLTIRRFLLLFCAAGLVFNALMGWFIPAALFGIGMVFAVVRKGVDR